MNTELPEVAIGERKRTVVSCLPYELKEREKIFNGLEYEKETKLIYKPCSGNPIGKEVNGKIKWFR